MREFLKKLANAILSPFDAIAELVFSLICVFLARDLIETAEEAGDKGVRFRLKTKVFEVSNTEKKTH